MPRMPDSLARRARSTASIERGTESGSLWQWISRTPWSCAFAAKTRNIAVQAPRRIFIAEYGITATHAILLGRVKKALIPVLAAVAAIAMLFVPPIHQDAAYHQFADQRTIWGIPNFWNVVSNLPFLAVALWGLRVRGDAAYRVFLFGVATVTFGSAYYHAWPSSETLFWDRLPMTIAFMALFAALIGDRISDRAGRMLLLPLLCVGAASVIYWRMTDDLRPYALVQFFPMLAIPLMMVLFPARAIPNSGLIGMM